MMWHTCQTTKGRTEPRSSDVMRVTGITFIFGGALALAMIATLFIGMAKPPRPPLLKAQPLQAEPILPNTVRTIPIVVPPTRTYREPEAVRDPLPPHRYVAPEPTPKKSKRAKRREREESRGDTAKRREESRGDICRGRGKRYTNNGRSWRCKRT